MLLEKCTARRDLCEHTCSNAEELNRYNLAISTLTMKFVYNEQENWSIEAHREPRSVTEQNRAFFFFLSVKLCETFWFWLVQVMF